MARLESILSLKQMRYFASVVEQRSFTAASQVLHIAQPALSRQIAQLEEAIGEQLLVRHAEGVTTTQAGLRCYDLARVVLERVNGAAAEVKGEEPEPQGRVTLALPATGGAEFITNVVRACKAELPQVDLQVLDGISTQTGHVLESGLVDVGVLPNADELDGVSSQPLFTEHLFAVYALDSARRTPPDIRFAELAAMPLVVAPRSMHLRRFIERAAQAGGIRLNIVYEQRSVATIAAFVRAGLAATVTNWPSVLEYFPTGAVAARRIVDPPLSRTMAICFPSARPMSNASRAVHALVTRLLLERVSDGRWRGEPLPAEPATNASANSREAMGDVTRG